MIQLLVMEGCSSAGISAILRAFKNMISLIHIIGPILLIIGLAMHLINLMRNPDEKKLVNKIRNSAIAAVVLFFIPTIVNALMYMVGENMSISSCWNSISNTGYSTTYISSKSDKKKSTILVNPSDYEKGVPKPQDDNDDTYTYDPIDGTARQVGDVVWDPSNVTRISNLTSAQLIGVLNAHGGKAKNFIPYASALITAEQKYNVNVFFLIGIEALESGWVTSSISRNCNNLGGVCQSKNHPSNGCGSNSNCAFAYFSSPNQFIDYHAKMLHENYLTPGGSYYHGTSPTAVVTDYCPGCSSWPSNVTSIANSLFNEVSKVL